GDVLHEVELLVAGGHPEVGAVVTDVLAGDLSEVVDCGESRLATERWIGQHQGGALLRPGRFGERIADVDQRPTARFADAVQSRFICASLAVPCTSSIPEIPPSRRCCASSLVSSSPWCRWMYSCAASRKPPVPQAGSMTVSSGRGRTQRTIASMSARGV